MHSSPHCTDGFSSSALLPVLLSPAGVSLLVDDKFLRRSTSLAYLAKSLDQARSKHSAAGLWGIYVRPTSVEGDSLEARRWAEVKHGPWGSLLHVLQKGFFSTNAKPDPPPIVKDAAKVGEWWLSSRVMPEPCLPWFSIATK
jgi:hypothetical protein